MALLAKVKTRVTSVGTLRVFYIDASGAQCEDLLRGEGEKGRRGGTKSSRDRDARGWTLASLPKIPDQLCNKLQHTDQPLLNGTIPNLKTSWQAGKLASWQSDKSIAAGAR